MMKATTMGHRSVVGNRGTVSFVERVKRYFSENCTEIVKAGLTVSGSNSPYALYRTFK